jgi:hypothetical protein
MRTITIAGATLAVLALGGALSACGGQPAGEAARGHLPSTGSPSSAPVATPPHITVVRLGTAFSPDRLRLSVGGQFLVAVSPSVHATVLGAPPGCAPGATATTTATTTATATGGLVSVRCASGGYLYTAERPGSAVISATVGPHCSPGQMCPQWLSESRLQVTIT